MDVAQAQTRRSNDRSRRAKSPKVAKFEISQRPALFSRQKSDPYDHVVRYFPGLLSLPRLLRDFAASVGRVRNDKILIG